MPDAVTITDEDTPNPNAWKFTADRVINPGPTRAYYNEDAAAGDALASALFAIRHVAGVMVVGDFVTVNKRPEGRWATLRPKVRAVLAEHLAQASDIRADSNADSQDNDDSQDNSEGGAA